MAARLTHLPCLALMLLAICGLILPAGAGEGQGRAPSAHANYLLRCSGCHLPDGEGLPASGIPAFPGYVDALAGDDEGRTYMVHVPGVVSSSLTDGEIAGVLNYVVEKWGSPASIPAFTADEVTQRRARDVEDVVRYRRAIVERLKASGLKVAEYPWP